MRQLLPISTGTDNDTSTDIDIATAYARPLGTVPNRPWVSLCMVASLDGSTVIDGQSGGLSSSNDSAVLSQLRSIADVVIVGSGTVSGEGYGPPKKPGQRIGVVTGSGSVDTSTELFTSGAGFVITRTGVSIDGPDIDVIRCGNDVVDLAEAVRNIPRVCPGASVIQAEGGPTLNGALADADLFDELNLTVSPGLVGGTGPRLVNTDHDHLHRYTLEQMMIDDDSFVFTRWRRAR